MNSRDGSRRPATVERKGAGVSFNGPLSRRWVWRRMLALTIPNPLHSEEEDRFITLGESHRRRLLVVVSTDRGDTIRIISARLASRRERRDYEEGTEEQA